MEEELKTFVREGHETMPEDQLHRYPTNKNGAAWKINLGFEPNFFLAEIARIKSIFERLKTSCKR